MKPVFTNAAIYEITARCMTPLHTGDDSGLASQVLMRYDGVCMIPGTSIAGALRNHLPSEAPLESLFGSQKAVGHLQISDGLFEPDTDTVLRPRVCIDPASGTALDGGKFEVRQIQTGSRFHFSVVWTGTAQELSELHDVEQLLSALHHGQILLGGQKSNGCGRVSLEVRKRVFDLTTEADRQAWIRGESGQSFELPDSPETNAVTFRVEASVPRVLVKSGSSNYQTVTKGDKEVSSGTVCNLMENGRAVIPGSSIKGSILSRLRAIARYLSVPESVLDEAFGRGSCETDNGKAGKFTFEDVLLEPKSQPITRIRIDRFTGGVMTGGLFKADPITGRMTAQIHAPADQEPACALLLFALRDLGLGLYNLGSGWAIGWGIPQVEQITATQGGKSLTLKFTENGEAVLEDPDDLAAQWRKALGGVCHAE